jgi:1-phosphatidylinositol phosphodiesterase
LKKLISLAAALLYSSVSPVLAQNDPGYYHGDFFSNGQAGDNPNWMAVIPGERRLSELSIPGTHNTMAKYGGDAVECQSMTLAQQLNSGVRALDIRCRHEGPSFRIFHGAVSQFADFAKDVLFVCNTFLAAHPTETILMRVKQEGKGDGVFGAAPIGTFDDAFEAYRKGMGSSFWINTGSNNPTLDEVRGKIVIIRAGFASTAGISYPWNDSPEGQLDSPKGSTLLQDRYKMSTNWDLYDKWENVKAHLNKAVNGRTNDLYVNFLSASGGSFPYFVASGHSSHETGSLRLATGLTTPGWSSTYPDFPRIACVPLIDIICLGFCDAPDVCTIVFEGINILTTDYINHGNARGRVGVIFADYPGWGLIEAVISLNGIRQVTNIEDSGQGSLRWAIETSLPSDPSAVDFSGGGGGFWAGRCGKNNIM